MKHIIILTIFSILTLCAEELQVQAKQFNADQKTGVSIFEGAVNVTKGSDELNASKVTIYVDEKQEPIKFVAEGDASFNLQTKDGSLYEGKAQKVIYIAKEKEYHFYKDVYLRQIDEKKEIIGEEVVLKTIEGKAYAKGAEKEPVIMIFNIPEKKEKKND